MCPFSNPVKSFGRWNVLASLRFASAERTASSDTPTEEVQQFLSIHAGISRLR